MWNEKTVALDLTEICQKHTQGMFLLKFYIHRVTSDKSVFFNEQLKT